jgi:hypothetical protein
MKSEFPQNKGKNVTRETVLLLVPSLHHHHAAAPRRVFVVVDSHFVSFSFVFFFVRSKEQETGEFIFYFVVLV